MPDRRHILITGAGGLLGGRLAQLLRKKAHLMLHFHHAPKKLGAENIFYGDLGDSDHVSSLGKLLKPDLIINCAALTDVDLCEREPELSKKINLTAVRLLLDCFPRAKMVHISTDYVFGERDYPGRPDDATGPLNTYGRHKLDAERLVAEASPDNLIVRTNTTYDMTSGNNFFKFVYGSLTAGKKIFGVTDQSSNPISSYSASDLILELINRDAVDLFHIGGQDFISRYDFAVAIARNFGLKSKLVSAKESGDLNRLAPRPRTAGLDCSATERFLKQLMPSIKDDFIRIYRENQTGEA